MSNGTYLPHAALHHRWSATALTEGEDYISGEHTAHTARRVPGTRYLWEVSWLPGRTLDHDRAVTAMVLADITAPGGIDEGHQLWDPVKGWAGVLGLSADDALALTLAATSPGAAPENQDALPADPEATG